MTSNRTVVRWGWEGLRNPQLSVSPTSPPAEGCMCYMILMLHDIDDIKTELLSITSLGRIKKKNEKKTIIYFIF